MPASSDSSKSPRTATTPRPQSKQVSLEGAPDVDKLSTLERTLCETVHLLPSQYLAIKVGCPASRAKFAQRWHASYGCGHSHDSSKRAQSKASYLAPHPTQSCGATNQTQSRWCMICVCSVVGWCMIPTSLRHRVTRRSAQLPTCPRHPRWRLRRRRLRKHARRFPTVFVWFTSSVHYEFLGYIMLLALHLVDLLNGGALTVVVGRRRGLVMG